MASVPEVPAATQLYADYNFDFFYPVVIVEFKDIRSLNPLYAVSEDKTTIYRAGSSVRGVVVSASLRFSIDLKAPSPKFPFIVQIQATGPSGFTYQAPASGVDRNEHLGWGLVFSTMRTDNESINDIGYQITIRDYTGEYKWDGVHGTFTVTVL